jgi:hypothetical protein
VKLDVKDKLDKANNSNNQQIIVTQSSDNKQQQQQLRPTALPARLAPANLVRVLYI